MSIGVISLLDQIPGRALIESVQNMESLGFENYWLPEVLGREVMSTVGILLANTSQIAIGTGIANVYVRDEHATVAAQQTLCEMFGDRFLLGLGVSNVGISEIRGYEWTSPVSKLNRYLDRMESIKPDMKQPSELGPIHIAAHGPKLQKLAAARCNGVMTYLMSTAHTELSRSRIGPGAELSVSNMMLLESDPERARATARKAVSYYLTLDYYHREWRQLGFTDEDFTNGGSDALIDMLVAWGDKNALQARVDEHLNAGASRVLVMPLDIHRERGLVDSATLRALAPG
ncbi:MAG: TIGR03620 family F420-dependent LLM class oxidoreductase [Pseudomonadota bacterium]